MLVSLPPPSPGAAVLVTGASSGIGAELSRELARLGHDLIIVARRRPLLDELAGELSAEHGVEVVVHERDLGSSEQRQALIADVRAGGRQIVGLCNNAGFGTTGRFHTLPGEREVAQVELNAVAVVELTHAFVGPMVELGAGAILNTASVAAFQPLPGLATYSATKAFVQTFSEALHAELAGTGVSCTVLCPGPVDTEWLEIAGADRVFPSAVQPTPRDVARAAVTGMVRGSRTVIPGTLPKLAALGGRLVPRTVLLPIVRLYTDRRTGSDD